MKSQHFQWTSNTTTANNRVTIRENTTEFSALEARIRSGNEPVSPTLLLHYLRLGDSYAARQPKPKQLETHTRILDFLLETICDTCVAQCWRSLCLEHSYRPLSALKRLASSQQEKRYVNEQYYKFRTLTHYFC